MSEIHRRQFIKSGLLAGGAALGLSSWARAFGPILGKKRKKLEMTIIRRQPDVAPDRLGFSEKGLANLTQVFEDMLREGLHPGAQLAVYRDGELAISLAGGLDAPGGNPVTETTLFQIRSVTKALTALVMLTLYDRGRFSFEDPVIKYWPEFGQNGKEAITIAQIMSHRAGIPDGPQISTAQMADRKVVAAAVEALKPEWTPGTANGYHAATYGWVLDELVFRMTGANVADFLKKEILEPLGNKDVFLGLPKEEFPRMAKMAVETGVRGRQDLRARFSDFMNTYQAVSLPLAWVCGVATAEGLANVMNLLAFEGTFGLKKFFSKQTQELAGKPTNKAGEMDRRLLWPVRWGLGFILGDTPDIYGTPPHAKALGHAGGGAGVAWGDPERRLAAAFNCNRMLGGTEVWERYRRIGDGIYAALK